MGLRILLAILIATFPSISSGVVTVSNPLFSIDLDDDWEQVQCANEEQVAFISQSYNAQLRIQFWDIKISTDKLEKAANGLVKLGLKQEQLKAPLVTIRNSVVSPTEYGYTVAYSGHDSNKRSFRYAGIVTKQKVLNLYLETPSRNESSLESLMQSIVDKIRY